MWKNMALSDMTVKCGACALHAEYLRLQTQHSEYVIKVKVKVIPITDPVWPRGWVQV